MPRDEIIGTLGAISSAIVTAIGFLWNIGVLQLIFSFLSGAFATYVVQHRLEIESEKRKIAREKAIEMRNTIYGPAFSWLTGLKDNVEEMIPLQHEEYNRIANIMRHFLFSTVESDVRKKISDVISRSEKYEKIREATEIKLKEIIRKKIVQIHKMDTEGLPSITTLVGRAYVGWMSILGMIFHGRSPETFVEKETSKWGDAISTQINIGGHNVDLEVFVDFYKKVLTEVEKEQFYLNERTQRELLLKEIVVLLKELRPLVEFD